MVIIVNGKDYTDEVERITEWLERNRGDQIRDRGSFESFFIQEILKGDEPTGRQDNLMDAVFKEYMDRTGIKDENIFRKAKGKDLIRDRQTDAKVIVDNEKEFIRRGASNVDLRNLDTATVFRGKVVKASKDTFKRQGRKVEVLRDRKGRFVPKRKA
jgi:hypothetical protein